MRWNQKVLYEDKIYLLDSNEFKKMYQEWFFDKEKFQCSYCKEIVIVSFGNIKRNDIPIYFRHAKNSNSTNCLYNSNNKEYAFTFSNESKDYYEENINYIRENYDLIFRQIVTYIWIWTKSYVNHLDRYIFDAIKTIKEQWKLNKSIDLNDIARIIISHMETIEANNHITCSVFFKDNTNKKYRKLLVFDKGGDYETVRYISSNRLKLTNCKVFGREKIFNLI